MRCRYCGRFAGLFSRSHKECGRRHSLAQRRVHDVLRRYFRGEAGIGSLKADVLAAESEGCLSEEDVCRGMDYAVRAISDSVCAPVAQGQIDAACSFLAAFKDKVPQECLEYAACRFVEAYVEESVSDGSDVEKARMRIDSILDLLGISLGRRLMVLKSAFCGCAGWIMRCKWDSAEIRCRFFGLCVHLGIDVLSLPEDDSDNAQLKTLCQLIVVDGLIGEDSQSVIWTYRHVEVFDADCAETGQGYPVLKGLAYKPGQFKGRPSETAGKEPVYAGKLEVYNDRLRLSFGEQELEVWFADVVRAVPYSDSLAVATSSRELLIHNVDAWFLMSLFNLS